MSVTRLYATLSYDERRRVRDWGIPLVAAADGDFASDTRRLRHLLDSKALTRSDLHRAVDVLHRIAEGLRARTDEIFWTRIGVPHAGPLAVQNIRYRDAVLELAAMLSIISDGVDDHPEEDDLW